MKSSLNSLKALRGKTKYLGDGSLEIIGDDDHTLDNLSEYEFRGPLAEEIDLSPEEEAELDRAWAALDEKNKKDETA